LAIKVNPVSQEAFSYCGSPIYIAPEIIQKQPYNKAVDFYALGTLMYELYVGVHPFYGNKGD
jgi:serine/threonine protein kinase